MITELHGKRYYIDMGPQDHKHYMLSTVAFMIINNNEVLKEEDFELYCYDGNYVIVGPECEKFRGPAYTEWEKFKRYIYKLKKLTE